MTTPVLTREMPKARVVGFAVVIAFALSYGLARLGWLPRSVSSWPGVAAVTLGTLVAHEALHVLTARWSEVP